MRLPLFQIVEMKRMARRLDCAMMASLAPTQCNEQPSFDLVFDEHDPSVWGLGCRDNRTLNLYVLDLITQWSLVQKLGLGQHEPNAIIVSLHDDKIFVMNEELSSKSLAKFVRAFHEDPESLKLLKLSSSISSSSASSEAIEEINADNFANKLLSFRTEPGECYQLQIYI